MAGSKSNYLSRKVLDHVLGNAAYSAPATVYVGLWKSTATLGNASTGGTLNEADATGTAYGRVAVTNNSTNWPNASGTETALKQNANTIAWPTATGAWCNPSTETINQFALVDASSSGNMLFWGTVTTPKAIGSGDTASFAAGALSITED